MSQKYPGGFITKSPVAPSASAARGVWTLDQALQLQKQGLWPVPPRVPGAPTIGTATQTSSTTATVAFTAPTDDGGAVITSYTATSSPQGITGTLNQAGSGTITVTGLTTGTTYTFTVRATNVAGQGPASAASNAVTPVLSPGQAFGGGFFAGQISTTANSVATHNIIIAPRSSGQTNLKWAINQNNTPGSASDINGPANTAAIVADGNSTTYPAAHFCNNLVTGGQTDWYMPAKNELEICYFNFKPTFATNNENFGINPNAVPARSTTYNSTFNPSRTGAASFQEGGAEAFTANFYWTSTTVGSGTAFAEDFASGSQSSNFYYGKNTELFVRALRRVPV
jgi:hypothetical protein